MVADIPFVGLFCRRRLSAGCGWGHWRGCLNEKREWVPEVSCEPRLQQDGSHKREMRKPMNENGRRRLPPAVSRSIGRSRYVLPEVLARGRDRIPGFVSLELFGWDESRCGLLRISEFLAGSPTDEMSCMFPKRYHYSLGRKVLCMHGVRLGSGRELEDTFVLVPYRRPCQQVIAHVSWPHKGRARGVLIP